MSRVTSTIFATVLSLTASAAIAVPPQHLISHNNTNFYVQAHINGYTDPERVVKPNSTKKTPFLPLMLLCVAKPSACPTTISINGTKVFDLEINSRNGAINIEGTQLKKDGYILTIIKNGPTQGNVEVDISPAA